MDEKELLLKLGYKIKFERGKKGLSQQELAELVGLSQVAIANIELGKSNIRFSNLYAIAQALGLSLGDFSDFRL